MKKFMIFLLMTFLYLGICQARSEASYPKDATPKLLSWVSPTPSQSFLTRSNATGTFDITPSSTVHLGVTSNNSVTFSRPVGAVLESLPGWPAGATVNTVDWKVDGSTFKTGGNTCVVEGLNVGNHTFNCELKLSNGDIWTSNTVNIIVAEENIMLTIVGATQACESDVVTLTAVINGQVQGHTYQWKVDGEAIPGATGQTYSFIPDTLFKTAIENENLSHEFTVEVNRDGCLQTVSPIHPFVILLKPELVLNFPEYVCENSTYNIDAFLSGSNSTIQPYQWKWFKNNTLYATTSEATLSLEAIEENLNAEWAVYAIFEDLACATDTAKMQADTVKFYEDVPSTFTFNLTNLEDDHHICVNSVARYQASAQVLDQSFDQSKFENATYKWYVNNELVATTNSDIYEFSFPVSGQYLVSVVAIYDNYPCTEFTDSDEMVVEDIPEIAIVGNNVICAGETTLLGVVPKWEGGLSNDFTYFYTKVASIHWFGNNVLVGTSTLDPYSSEQIGVHSVSEPGVYVATVIFEESGCAASAEFTVTQFGADLQVSASEMLVCPGTTVTLNANVDGWNNENIKYQWNTGDTSSTISAVVDRDSVFTVTASAGDNCSLVQTINVKAIPAENIQLTVKAEVDTICVGGRVKATIENADPDYQGFYTWYLNGFEVAGSNLDTIFFDVNNAGIYSVAATLSNFSCGADTVSAVDTFVVVGGNTLVLAGDNVVCPGDTAVVIATKIDGAKYTWLGPNVENANNDTLRTAVPGIYALTVEDTLYGCPALTADFTINQIGADLQVYASDVLVCPGTKVTVRANLDGFSNWNVAYAWSTEDTTSAAIATVSTDTTFVVTAFVTAPNSNNVCSLTDSINVFVYDTTSVQLVVNATPENICQGSQVNLKVRPIITSDATVAAPESYIWYINGVEIPGQNLDSVILSLNEPGNYEFSVRPANQVCKVQPATYAQTPVTVYAIPEMYIAGDFVVCNGDTAVLAPIIQPADDKFTFTWNTGSTDSLLKVTEAGVYHVYAIGDKGKCYANASFSVTTFGGDLHVSADKYSVCESEMVVLTANLDGMQNENIKYAWSQNVNGTVSPLDTTSTLQVYPTDTTTYIVTAIAGNCSMVDSVTVNVILTPTTVDLTVSALEDTVCVGSQATISVASNDNHSYVWYQNGVVIPGENLSAITVNLNEPGMYVYAATPANTACVVSSTESMDTIWVFANPEVALTGNSVICNGDTAKILATVLNGNPADYTYLWSNNDNDSLLNVVEAGIYTVTVTNKNTKCEATADVAVTTFGGDLHVSADKYSVCESEMVVLTANLDGMQNENIKYAWSQNVKGTITNLDTTSTLQVYPTDTTTYIVTAIAGNCSMVDSVTVNVILTPTTVNLTVSALEDTVCVGGQATLSVASTDNHSYVWYQNGIVIPGENLNTIRVNLNEPGMYVYAATPANTACVVSSTESMDTIWVFANPEVYITGDHFYTVNGDSAKLFATKLENCIYVWSNGATTDSIVVADAAVYTVTVTDTLTGCSTTVEYKVDAVVNAQVNIVGVESACMSDVVTLTAVVDHDLIGVKYQWLIDGQYIPGATEQHYAFRTDTLYEKTGLLTHDIQVEVSREGCEELVSPVHKFAIRPVPMAVISAPEYICEGDSTTFEVVVYALGTEEQYSYAWFQDDENTPLDTIEYINTHVFTTAELTGHKYGVKVLYQDTACASSVSEFVGVKFYEKPAQIHLTVNADTACQGAQMVYTLENVVDTLIPHINWYINGVKVDNAHDTIYSNVYENAGDYHVYARIDYEFYPCETMLSNDTLIHIFAQPTVQITGDPIICNDSLVTLFAMINDTIGSKDYSYEWRLYNFTLAEGDNYPEFTSELEANYQNIAINFESDSVVLKTNLPKQDHPYIFTTEITTEHGCVAKSEPFYVYVGENPTVAVTVNYDTVCVGAEVTATAHLGNYNMDNLTYKWSENGTEKAHGTSRVYVANIDSTTVFSVEVIQTTTQCKVTGEDSTVVVRPRNIDHILILNQGDIARDVCKGAQLDVTAYFYNEQTGEYYVDTTLYYNWTVNGMDLYRPHGAFFQHQPDIIDNDPVEYIYSVYVTYDYPNCTLAPVASDTVLVKPNPTVVIDGTPNVCYFNDNDYNITLTAWVNGKQDTTATYTWYESGQIRPNVGGYDNKYRASWPATYLNPWIFEVVAENGNGCTAKSAPFEVNVYDAPVVNITGDADSICLGGSATLRANLDNYNDPMLTYQWYENVMDENHKLNGFTLPEVTVTPTVSTNYIARVTHLMYSGTSGAGYIVNQSCWSVDTFKLQVNPRPVVDSISNNIPDTNVVCDGYQLVLKANIHGGVQGGEVYTWYRNGDIIPGATQPEFTEVLSALNYEPTTYTYAVEVKQSADGCSSDKFTMKTFTVNPNPVVELTTDPIVCIEQGENIVMAANVYPQPETEVKFNWFEDNTLIAENYGDTLKIHRNYRDYPYSFSVQLVNEFGCISESSALVYVKDAPVVNITATDTILCVGGETTLSLSLNDWNAELLTMNWLDNGDSIPGATSYQFPVKPSVGTHVYTVNLLQLNSLCTATSDSIKVVVYPDPVITSVTVNDYNVCVGSQLTITANIADTVEGEKFTWYRNNTIIPGAEGRVITDSPELVDNNTQQFTYTAVVTRPQPGCTSLPVTSSTVTVYPNPTVVITGDQYICETDSVFLIANVDTVGLNTGLLHYTWYESGQIRSNSTYNLYDNQFYAEHWYARTEPYRFTVEVTRDNVASGCISRSEVFNVYVFEQPKVTITASETDICTDGVVTLTANLLNNNAEQMIYQWYKLVETQNIIANGYNADGSYKYDTTYTMEPQIIEGAYSTEYTVAVGETTTYGVYVVQAHSMCKNHDEITINVNPIPVVTNITVNDKSSDVVCNGAQVTVAATIEPANAAGATYKWYRNNELIPFATEASFSENVYTTDNHVTVNNYTAIVTLPAAGCQSLMSDSVATVTINPAPSTVAISGNNVICFGDSTVLTAYSDVEGQFIWSNGVTDTNKITVNAGTYTVTMKTTEGCEMTSAPFTVQSFGTDIWVTASETAICQGEHTTLYVGQNGWNGNVTYAWAAPVDSADMSHTTVDVTPDTTTVYQVTATVNNENGSCSATREITIKVTPRPAIVNVTPKDTAVCEGSQITFHADGNAHSYIWYANGFEVEGENQANLTVNFNEEGVYSYAAKAVNEEGCVSAQASEPAVVKVNAAPESVTISGQLVICDGGSTTLYANVTPNVTASYTWYKDNVSINTNTQSISVTEAGSYKVEATVNGCTTVSDAVVVTVQQTPQLQLSATDTVLCVGGETTIYADVFGWNNDAMIFNWSNGWNGDEYKFVPNNPGTYKFVVTASQSTSGSVTTSGCVAMDSIYITVNNIPMTPFITVDHDTICTGGQVMLAVSASTQTPGAKYTWLENGSVLSGAEEAVIYLSPVAIDNDVTTYNYKAIAEIEGLPGCTSNIASYVTTVTVIPTPTVAVSVVGNTTICADGTTTLNANASPAGLGYTYQWYKDNVLIPGANNPSYTVSEAPNENAYNFSVVVTANAGCSVTANAPAITVVGQPTVVASISSDVSCVGGQVTMTAEAFGGVENVNNLNPYQYAWYSNLSTTTPIATTQSYTTTGDEAAGNYSYKVVVTSAYGCVAEAIVNHIVSEDPTVAIEVAQGYASTVCDGGQTMLKAVVNGGVSAGTTTYRWFKNGIELYGENNPTLLTSALSINETQNYVVIVKQEAVGCEATSAAFNVNVAPKYNVVITGNYQNVCEGGTLTLTATVTNPLNGDYLSYQWYKIANGSVSAIAGATEAQYQTSDLILGGSYEYFVKVTSSISGCDVESGSVPANVVAAPTVTISGAHTVCENGALTLNAVVNGGVAGAAYTYTWSWVGAETGDSTTVTPSFVPVLNASDAAAPYYFTVTIKRNDNTGCEATSAAHEVNVNARPTVTVTADNAYICQNGEVTFTAHVSPVGAYNYKWTINNQAQSVNSSSITTTSANTGSISATVEVQAANSSSSCSATATIVTPVQVVSAPTVVVTADNYAMCVGGTAKMSASVSHSANIPGNFNYQWIVEGIEVAGAVDSTFVQTFSAPGSYEFKLRVSQNNNLGCSSVWSAPVIVKVAEQPVITLNSENGLAICEGGSVKLTATVDNYNNVNDGVQNSSIYGAMTYDWTSNGIPGRHVIKNQPNAYIDQTIDTLNTVGNYNYQVKVTPNGYNCQPQVSNIEVVNVVSNPSWTDVHVYSSNGVDACLGEMVTLMAAIQGGASDYEGSTNGHIQWVVTDSIGNTINVSGGLGGNSYDIPATAGVYIYTPTFVGNIGSGCQLTNTADVQTTVTVHELPTAQFTNGDGASICANNSSSSAELEITFTGTAPFTFQVVDNFGNVWANATTNANTTSIYVSPDVETTFFINMLSDKYCVNNALDVNATATVYVNEVKFDETMFVSGCNDNGTVTVNFNVIQGNSNGAFTVIYENGLQASGTISNGSATFAAPTVPGDYNAVLTINGCDYDIVVRVLVGEYGFGGTLPIMDQRWNDVVVVNNNPATNGGHTFVGFQWYKNGVAIPGATYSNYQDKDGLNGFYSVELIEKDENGNMVTFMTCETYFNSVSSVKVYPVPANVHQEITIELDLTSEELDGAVLDIYSVTGALISHLTDLQPITKIQGFKAQGTYFGRILTGTNEIKTVKFVIVK